GVLLYQAVLAFAAVRAVVRELRGDRGWEKTAHMGLHLARTAAAPRRTNGSPHMPGSHERGAPKAVARCAVLEPSAEGNGSNGSIHRTDDLVGSEPGEPLWARLGPLSTDGAASLPLP